MTEAEESTKFKTCAVASKVRQAGAGKACSHWVHRDISIDRGGRRYLVGSCSEPCSYTFIPLTYRTRLQKVGEIAYHTSLILCSVFGETFVVYTTGQHDNRR